MWLFNDTRRWPGKSPAHPGHHEADDEGCDGVKDRVTGKLANEMCADVIVPGEMPLNLLLAIESDSVLQ